VEFRCLNTFVHHQDVLIRVRDVIDSILRNYELPQGRWYDYPISDSSGNFLSRLVYEPLK
jgi:hypothetical protein